MGRPRKDASTGGSSTAYMGATAPTSKPATTRSAPSSARTKTTAVTPTTPARPASSQGPSKTASRSASKVGRGDMNNNQDVGTRASSEGGKSGPSKSRSSQPTSVKASRDGYHGEPLYSFHEGLGKAVADIEQETRGQRDNPKWHEWRENRITASNAHKISHSKFVNDKSSEVPKSYLKQVTSPSSNIRTPALDWGVKNEKRAIQEYEHLKSKSQGERVTVDDCGLYIHPKKSWLAASPDGIVKDRSTGKPQSLVEVKCPYKYKDHTIKDACKDDKFCLKSDGDSYALKKDHPYYTQVQTQMATTGLKTADFVVHTNKETAYAPVTFDTTFWKATEPKLEKFYREAVIPHMEGKAGQMWVTEE